MKNVTFYLEYPTKADKRAKRGNPPVLAAIGKPCKNSHGNYVKQAIASVGDQTRTQFSSFPVPCEYIERFCTRISEAKARIAHPEIFNCGLL